MKLVLFIFSDVIAKIGLVTRGQRGNSLWFSFRKRLVAASHIHEGTTKMAENR